MSLKKAPEDRTVPRQIRMSDAFHAQAMGQAAGAGLDLSAYVRGLIEADGKRAAKQAARR